MKHRRPSLPLVLCALGGGLLALALLLDSSGEIAWSRHDATSSVVGQPLAQDSPVGSAAPPFVASPGTSDMIVVPAGMVAKLDASPGSATKGRDAFVAAFVIARTEVTNAAFAEFVRQTGYRTLAELSGDPRTWRTQAIPGTDALPVTFIAWADANAFCEHAGRRLPTEFEWERAARGDDGRLWPWGNDWDGGSVNSLELGRAGPAPVGSYPQGASPYGLVDMAGNVWEWTSSPYVMGSAPAGPNAQATETFREHWVLRGGSWRTMAAGTRVTYRKPAPKDYRRDTTGFRCAGEIPTAEVSG